MMVFGVFLVPVGLVGLSSEVVSSAQVFAVPSAIAAVTSIPLMNSASIYEAIVISALAYAAGQGSIDLAIAAVVLNSLFVWLG